MVRMEHPFLSIPQQPNFSFPLNLEGIRNNRMEFNEILTEMPIIV
jgi:hypothetical protein